MAKLKGHFIRILHVKMMMFILGAKNIILIIKCENKQTLGNIRLLSRFPRALKKSSLARARVIQATIDLGGKQLSLIV